MGGMPITRSTDGDWNLQPTISHLNGYQEQETKLLTASPVWSNYQMIAKPQSRCSQPSIWTDQHSTQEAKHHNNIKQPKDTRPSNTPSLMNPATSDLTTVETTQDRTPKPLTANRCEALPQMQRMDPFCKFISRQLSNGKAPQHGADLFTHIKGLLYKHIMDANQKFMALIIPKAWKYTVLVEAHDRLRH